MKFVLTIINEDIMSNEIMNPLVVEVKSIIDAAKARVAQTVNNELIISYWKIGEIIVRYEQNDSIRAEYGERTLKVLSKELTKEFGKGFSRSNLQNMHAIYLAYPIHQSLTGKLSKAVSIGMRNNLLPIGFAIQ